MRAKSTISLPCCQLQSHAHRSSPGWQTGYWTVSVMCSTKQVRGQYGVCSPDNSPQWPQLGPRWPDSAHVPVPLRPGGMQNGMPRSAY